MALNSSRDDREDVATDSVHAPKLSEQILDCCIKIHRTLGPGLLESVYQNCLVYELERKGISCQKELMLPVHYEELTFESGFRADIIVENKIIIELKAVEKTQPVHRAQLLTYLKLTNKPLGLLINFNNTKIINGFQRFANGDEANDL
jgi:GxxExxY protein